MTHTHNCFIIKFINASSAVLLTGLQLDARVGAPHATQLRTLLEQASLMKESLPPVGVASLVSACACVCCHAVC